MDQINYFDYHKPQQKKVRIAWRDCGGTGKPVLLVHGFIGTFAAWEPLMNAMGPGYRYFLLDLKGYDDEKEASAIETLSPYDQAEVIREFIRVCKLDNFLLIGHSMGATAAAIAAVDLYVKRRLENLILIAPLGMDRALPEKITGLTSNSPEHNPLLRNVGDELIAYWLLSLFTASPEKISDAMIHSLADDLHKPGTRQRLTAAARQLFVPDQFDFIDRLRKIEVKTLIVWGKDDHITSPDNATIFRKEITHCTVKIVPDCGHIPHVEAPDAVAALIRDFPGGLEIPVKVDEPLPTPSKEGRRIKLRRLFDQWTFGTVGFLLFLKFLHFLRKCGVKAEENGWRKATGIFMRNEYSKFILSCFRLKYFRSVLPPADQEQAKRELIERLQVFLHGQSSFHWSAEPGFFTLGRRKTFFCDIVVATYTHDGKLAELEPFFDDERENFSILSPEQIQDALREVVRSYNRFSRIGGQRRALAMQQHLKRWANRIPGYRYAGRTALRLLLDRLMTATYLHCEVLSPRPDEAQRQRLRTPNLKKYRHPGWGLLNIFCRFTPDFNEADLWVQFHHVPVDGAPMQELLDKLRNEWGSRGQILFPAPGSPDARPEIFHCGDRLFRAKFYLDFSKMLSLRKFLNSKYKEQMGGTLTLAGMILWGLSKHPYFAKRKMLFPVDASDAASSRERELSLVFIRPAKFASPEDPLAGFLKFQAAFNRMVEASRRGEGESTEFLNLCSVAHPVFYHLTDMFLPNTLREIVGTVGVSIIRDAEMFISPLSDFQTAGFMAIGSMNMPTEDGGHAGAVTVCASRVQVRYYITAMTEMADEYYRYLGLPEQPARKS